MIRYFWRSDDEQLAGQFIDSHFDEDGSWWVSVQKAGAVVALAATLAIAGSTTQAAQQVFSQVQDDPALSTQILAIEEYWQNPTPPTVWPQTAVFTDDDVHPTFVSIFAPDDGDYWHQLTAPVPDSNYVRLPFLEPEDFPQFPVAVPVVDDSSIWVPQLPPSDPDVNVLFFLDDGSWVPAMEPDEDFLPSQALPAPWNWPQPAQAIFDTDEQVAQFPAEDDFWPQYVTPVADSLIWPQPWIFEQNESTNLVAFTTEEHGWPIPVPVPATLWVLRQDAFEQNDATGSLTLTLDDSFQPLVVPGVPAPSIGDLRLLQQWQFEQNEPSGSLRNNVDELYWQNPVPAIASWPVPAFYTWIISGNLDEIVVPQSTTTIDEVYQSVLVAPVPDRLGGLYGLALYLPEPEEIPAGSLFVPIPPPPINCPLPPLGPDNDIKMSVFSNFRGGPVLALFCRICSSGKPLVVRADYAIWCQDCCAFVSKQDTYMGTVRAPGVFKTVF